MTNEDVLQENKTKKKEAKIDYSIVLKRRKNSSNDLEQSHMENELIDSLRRRKKNSNTYTEKNFVLVNLFSVCIYCTAVW